MTSRNSQNSLNTNANRNITLTLNEELDTKCKLKRDKLSRVKIKSDCNSLCSSVSTVSRLSSKSLNRFLIYENLCKYCGFAIGTGSIHTNCPSESTSGYENIYENICNSCQLIYSGDKCMKCECSSIPNKNNSNKVLAKRSNSGKHLGKQFTFLINNFKQKLKEKSPQSGKVSTTLEKDKIQIIHNFDKVFKTNKTFDLNEIALLKAQKEKDIYNKSLNCNEINVPRKENKQKHLCITTDTSYSETACELSISQNYQTFFPQPTSSSVSAYPSIEPDIYSNAPPSYDDAIQNSMYGCVKINHLQFCTTNRIDFSSTSSSIFSSHSTLPQSYQSGSLDSLQYNDSLATWMTSLQRQTYDYQEDDRTFECVSVKCIPSKLDNLSAYSHNKNINNFPILRTSEVQSKLRENIEWFKMNLTEQRRAKRNGIYFKEWPNDAVPLACAMNEIRPLSIKPATSELNQNSVDLNVTNNADIGFLRRKNVQSELIVTELAVNCIDAHSTKDNDSQQENSELSAITYFHALKTFYLFEITLSTSLNRLVIVWHDKIAHNFFKSLISNCNPNSQPIVLHSSSWTHTKYIDLNSILKKLQKIKNPPPPKMVLSCVGLGKSVSDEIHKQKNMLNKFAEKKSHYSSTAIKYQNKPNAANVTVSSEIYQPIWMFKTVGGESIKDKPDFNVRCNSVTIADGNEWEIAEEDFIFSGDQTEEHLRKWIKDCYYASDNGVGDDDENGNSEIYMPKLDVKEFTYEKPFRSICILYNKSDSKLNKFIYDYQANEITQWNDNQPKQNIVKYKNNYDNTVENVSKRLNGKNIKDINLKLDSINAWKKMIRTVDYVEDEEDLTISEPVLSTSENSGILPILAITNKTPFVLGAQKTSAGKAKEELGLLKEVSPKRFDKPSTCNIKNALNETVLGLFHKDLSEKNYANSSPAMEIKRLNERGNLVYGVELEDIEKDENFPDIPKFVIKCIEIIEKTENLETLGIYRESGKKESIDRVRKKMNESKLRKGTKYVSLKDEDIHTITGALKQFFRELKTDLIPTEIVKKLTNDFGKADFIARIRTELSTINYLPRETLKYLLKHLIVVSEYRKHNLMSTSNLSIVWGACIFASSASSTYSIETDDWVRQNKLFEILLERFDDIFIDVDRLI